MTTANTTTAFCQMERHWTKKALQRWLLKTEQRNDKQQGLGTETRPQPKVHCVCKNRLTTETRPQPKVRCICKNWLTSYSEHDGCFSCWQGGSQKQQTMWNKMKKAIHISAQTGQLSHMTLRLIACSIMSHYLFQEIVSLHHAVLLQKFNLCQTTLVLSRQRTAEVCTR